MDMPSVVLLPSSVIKRDGRIVEFDQERIEKAIEKCFLSLKWHGKESAFDLTQRVVNVVSARYKQPTVEQIQDVVEQVLQAQGEFDAAKHYILYRENHAKQRKEKPIPEDVRQAFAESDQYFPTQLQKFQFYDKYSRFDYSKGRRETWVETVDRAVDYLRELSKDKLPNETYNRIRQAILDMRAMPSMRLLAMAGPAARRNGLSIFNCSYLPVDSIDSFVECLIISLSGCGVGYSVESKYVDQFPRIKRQTNNNTSKHLIDDSSEGWANALRLGLETWFSGKDVVFDFSQIRPAGSPLKIKGGRASGADPLRYMLNFIRSRILARQGSFLRTLDAHDIMCAIGQAVVSGGVRRTALISLFDWDDHEMRHCKDGDFERENSQRWNANNSAVWPEHGLTQTEIIEQMLDMIKGGRGEPGIFNRQAAISMRPERRQAAAFGTNPCVTGDTWVMTDSGATKVSDLIGKKFTAVVDGGKHESNGFWETGIKPVLSLKTKEGYSLRLTENHKVLVSCIFGDSEKTEWVEARKLKVGDKIKLHSHQGFSWNGDGTLNEGWLLGELLGDGTFDTKNAKLVFWGETRKRMSEKAVEIIRSDMNPRSDFTGYSQDEYDRTLVTSSGLRNLAADYGIYHGHKTITDYVERASSEFYRGFLQGLFDADGTVVGTQRKGVSVRLSQSDIYVLCAVQRMLLRLGITSAIYKNRHPAGMRMMPNGYGELFGYECRASHELVIANDNLIRFANLIDFSEPEKKSRLSERLGGYKRQMNQDRFLATVESISPDGIETVYDCTVPDVSAFDANGLYVHNCGEVILKNHELCNLSIAVARENDTYESLKEKVEIATIIGTIQSMETNYPGLRPVWRVNSIEERLLGVDITGQLDSQIAQNADVMDKLREYAVAVNKQYAAVLGINQSAAISVCKPSGNSSQLLNCASGIHARHSEFYIRNVRVGAHSPVFKVMRDAGVPLSPENGQTAETATTWVASFPVKSPEGAQTKKSRSAIQQCEYWLQNKLHWTEHNPSVTISYQPYEILDLIKWVWEHKDVIGGMSFLPADNANYNQMPYIEISKEEYEKRLAEFPEIDFSKLYRYEDSDLTTAAQELACVSGTCELL